MSREVLWELSEGVPQGAGLGSITVTMWRNLQAPDLSVQTIFFRHLGYIKWVFQQFKMTVFQCKTGPNHMMKYRH